MSRKHREELKRLWFSLDRSNVPERKEIIVETNYGHVEITSDGPDGYSSFKTNQGDNAMQYALDSKEYKSNKYKLIVK
tara:strand:+ start:163 stop:396 length:234 start_codon:yes stop_codon:yes gene_type:complete